MIVTDIIICSSAYCCDCLMYAKPFGFGRCLRHDEPCESHYSACEDFTTKEECFEEA